MAVCFFAGSGGGVDTTMVTATAAEVLSGKVIVDANGNALTGTMPNNGAVSQKLAINGTYTIPKGYHNGSGKVTQSIATMGAQTITPSGSAQTVACSGKYMTGNITVKAGSVAKIVTGTVKATLTEDVVYVKDAEDEFASSVPYWELSLSGFKSIYAVLMCGQPTSYTNGYDNESPVMIQSATSAFAGLNNIGKYTMSGCTFSTTYLKLPAIFYAHGSSYLNWSTSVKVGYIVYGYAS